MKLMKMATVMGVVAVLAGPALAVQSNAAALLAVKKAQSDAVTVVPVSSKDRPWPIFIYSSGGSCAYCFPDGDD